MSESHPHVFTFARDLRWPSLSREIRIALLKNGQSPRLIDQMLGAIKLRYDRLALPSERALYFTAPTTDAAKLIAVQCKSIDEDAFELARSAVNEICRAVIDLYVERYENGCVMLSSLQHHGGRSEVRH